MNEYHVQNPTGPLVPRTLVCGELEDGSPGWHHAPRGGRSPRRPCPLPSESVLPSATPFAYTASCPRIRGASGGHVWTAGMCLKIVLSGGVSRAGSAHGGGGPRAQGGSLYWAWLRGGS